MKRSGEVLLRHITIINQYIGAPSIGMEYRHYYLAKNLQKLGYKVTLVSGSYSHLFSTPPKVTKPFEKQIIDGIEYIWMRVPTYRSSKSLGRIWNMLCFAWRLRFLKELSPSHVIVSSPSLFPIKFGKKLAARFGTKFLFEVRDIWPLTLCELSGLSCKHPLTFWMQRFEKFGYQKSDGVISLLPMAKEYYMRLGMPEEKFYYLPNGIEIEDTNVKPRSIPLPEKVLEMIPKDKFIVAYTGTVGIANNLGYLIEVAKLLQNEHEIHFIILGNGGEKENLQQNVRELGLENVTFIDAVTKEQVHAFLQYVDISFISLLKESLFRFGVSPNKVFDYMYAKKPIIWAIEAGNNLVEEAKCGVSVKLGDAKSLKKSILQLKSMDKEKLRYLGNNGYNFVLKNHSYKMLAQKLIKIIEE